MTRAVRSLAIDDISQFCKHLRERLADEEDAPGHQSLLNIVVKSAGFKNLQHFNRFTEPAEKEEPADLTAITRALRHFDALGRLASWPARRQNRALCLWALWARLPVKGTITEREISVLLDEITTFEDAAHWRRALIEEGLVTRNPSGSEYRRVNQRPTGTVCALLRALKRNE